MGYLWAVAWGHGYLRATWGTPEASHVHQQRDGFQTMHTSSILSSTQYHVHQQMAFKQCTPVPYFPVHNTMYINRDGFQTMHTSSILSSTQYHAPVLVLLHTTSYHCCVDGPPSRSARRAFMPWKLAPYLHLRSSTMERSRGLGADATPGFPLSPASSFVPLPA